MINGGRAFDPQKHDLKVGSCISVPVHIQITIESNIKSLPWT